MLKILFSNSHVQSTGLRTLKKTHSFRVFLFLLPLGQSVSEFFISLKETWKKKLQCFQINYMCPLGIYTKMCIYF
jgi:hypothetical protein